MSECTITIERVGRKYEWEARGTLRDGARAGSLHIPAGIYTMVGAGATLTRRGADRQARRAIRRYC